MDNRVQRINTALSTIRQKLTERSQAVSERDALRKQLASVTAKWQALKSATFWAELDSGKSIAVGDEVRYFGRQYVCIKAHTKALLRLPSNTEYWSVQKDE